MKYKQMINRAKARGVASEKAMWAGIDNVDSLLELLKEEHPEEYWEFMRKTHEDLYGPHYDEEFAEYDLSQIHYTDFDGIKRTGPHWTKDEVLQATQNKVYEAGTTDCDKYVAYNVMYADICKKYSEDDALEIAYLFFFADEDAESGKIWRYMNCK